MICFDDLCDRFADERVSLCAKYQGRWVVYTATGVVANEPTEAQATRAAFTKWGDVPFIVDQVLPERPMVFIGGGAVPMV